MSKERAPSLPEKALWWSEVGGIIAAVVGIVGSVADLAVGGGVVAVGSHIARDKMRRE